MCQLLLIVINPAWFFLRPSWTQSLARIPMGLYGRPIFFPSLCWPWKAAVASHPDITKLSKKIVSPLVLPGSHWSPLVLPLLTILVQLSQQKLYSPTTLLDRGLKSEQSRMFLRCLSKRHWLQKFASDAALWSFPGVAAASLSTTLCSRLEQFGSCSGSAYGVRAGLQRCPMQAVCFSHCSQTG